MPEHLTDEQLSRHHDRTLTPVELLELDGHISACAACRDLLYSDHGASAKIKALRTDLSEHLDYAEIVGCSEGNGKPLQLNHIRQCADCQAEVQDLSRFRTELVETPRKPAEEPKKALVLRYRIPLGIAAAVLAIAGATTFALRQPTRVGAPPQAAATPQQHADPALPAAERQMLELALSTGFLERAPVLDKLIARPGALPSGLRPRPPIVLLAPVGTAVLTDRPVLRWTPTAEATSYAVAIFDEKLQKVAESPTLTVTDWRPDAPLPRGVVLNWQVTARTPKGAIHAPTPPTPEARFQVVPPEFVQRIETFRRDFPGNPLLLAVLFARAGALDDAEVALRSMDANASQSYLEGLRRVRSPE